MEVKRSTTLFILIYYHQNGRNTREDRTESFAVVNVEAENGSLIGGFLELCYPIQYQLAAQNNLNLK